MKYNFCVEDEIEGVEPFLTGTPRNLINKGDFRRIPVLLGANERERYQTAQSKFKLLQGIKISNRTSQVFTSTF